MLLRERPLMPVGVLPPPASLPNLRDALARRAAVFGPVEADPAPAGLRSPLQALGALARRVADALDQQGTK